jgi:hypothetical protein
MFEKFRRISAIAASLALGTFISYRILAKDAVIQNHKGELKSLEANVKREEVMAKRHAQKAKIIIKKRGSYEKGAYWLDTVGFNASLQKGDILLEIRYAEELPNDTVLEHRYTILDENGDGAPEMLAHRDIIYESGIQIREVRHTFQERLQLQKLYSITLEMIADENFEVIEKPKERNGGLSDGYLA